MYNLGEVARFQGNLGSAAVFYIKSLAVPQREDGKVHMYCGLADIERLQGHFAEAGQYLLNALNLLSNETERNFYICLVIPVVARFGVDLQKYIQVTSLFGWVDGWNKTNGIIQQPMYQTEFDRYLFQAREQLSASEFNAAWAEGQSMGQEQILALAMEVLQ